MGKIAIYARVSTSDKDQNPDTQLLPLRDFCAARGLQIFREYVDQASANDLGHRTAWRDLLDDAVKRGVVEFDATDSHDLKIQYAYRLLVHDKAISPIPNEQISLPNIKHRLAMWVTHKLPPDHKLLR